MAGALPKIVAVSRRLSLGRQRRAYIFPALALKKVDGPMAEYQRGAGRRNEKERARSEENTRNGKTSGRASLTMLTDEQDDDHGDDPGSECRE